MSEIIVDGKKYKVVESLPRMQTGMVAKVVETVDGEKVVVKRGGVWTWWTVQDRLSGGMASRCVGQTFEDGK